MLNATNIHLTLGSVPLLHGIDFHLTPGSVTVLMGPNGTGKTSLLRVLTGELPISAGNVELNGKDVNQWRPTQRSQMMAVLTQNTNLNFPFLVEEVVLLGRTPHRTGVKKDKKIAQEVLRLVDADYLRGRIYTRLSGGEKQRVQLARVLAQLWEPSHQEDQVLILDEPTASFDLAHQQLMLETIRHVVERGIAVLMVMHDFNLAVNSADQIVLLSRGHIAACGTPHEVVKPQTIKEIFGVDVDVIDHPQKQVPLVIPR